MKPLAQIMLGVCIVALLCMCGNIAFAIWRHRQDKIPNPRSRKLREPLWYTICLYTMYGVNAITAWMIFVLLVAMGMW
jgi:hypothetical protein